MNSNKLARLSVVFFATSTILGGCIQSDNTAEPTEPTSEVTSATIAECSNVNGFVDISDSLSGTVQRRLTMNDNIVVNGRRQTVFITQESATVGGVQRGFAKISGSTHRNDQIWMDWTENGGTNFRQCGPFPVGADGLSATSAAKQTINNPLVRFRACARLAGANVSVCNDWW